MTATSSNPTSQLWPLIHAERAALGADLATLDEQAWSTPSLCSGLTVREVLAHLTSAANLGPVRWMAGVIRCRFDFDRQVAMRLAEHLGASPAGTLAGFERVTTSTTAPPLPRIALLGEVVVHGEDIRRPLGIRREYPISVVTRLARYYARSNQVVVAKDRVAGLRFAATDGPFATGAGPIVSGPTIALAMAMTGRAAYCDDLAGDGVPTLRARC